MDFSKPVAYHRNMITEKQQKWLDHLRTDDEVVIKPYDPKSLEIFEKVKIRALFTLDGMCDVLHRGASYLGISGQDEIDVYVPVLPKEFDQTVFKMIEAFGQPRSLYPLVRARFPIEGYGKHIDVFVINKEDAGWVDSEIFTSYLLKHPKTLEAYRKLKEDGNGLSTRKYYTRKTEFINDVIEKARA